MSDEPAWLEVCNAIGDLSVPGLIAWGLFMLRSYLKQQQQRKGQ